MSSYLKIIIPTRPQVDTCIAIFFLKKFGTKHFPGISTSPVEVMATLPPNTSPGALAEQGMILLDIGGGEFDHHNRSEKITTSELVAKKLEIFDDPAIAKLLALAQRDDFEGKGTLSADSLDRAFGLPGLLAALNKTISDNPNAIVEIIMPLFEGHLAEEIRRTKELPAEFQKKQESNQVETFTVRQRDKNLKVVFIESDNLSMPGFLRSRLGGAYDVVAQRHSTGHLNILTRPAKRIDLRALVGLIRAEELMLGGNTGTSFDMRALSRPGRIDSVPKWYYDTATNSLQNGGAKPGTTECTLIPRFSIRKILETGLSEEFWSPMKN